MLKRSALCRLLSACVAAAAVLAGAVAASYGSPAAPADQQTRSCWIWVEVGPGAFDYINICENPGDDGDDDSDDDGGVVVGPPCELSDEPFNEFCRGDDACWADIPSPIPVDQWPKPPPSPDAIFTNIGCFDPDADEPEVGPDWLDEDEIPDDALPDLGWEAYGKLQTPAFTLSFEPAGMTYVGADTVFAIHGIGDGEIIGSEAGPLQATGTLAEVEIDPGDGSQPFRCDPALEVRTRECQFVYLRMSLEQPASDVGGLPAYAARARLLYDVTFTVGGVAVNVPGVPDVLESPWNGTLVPVGEIQALVQ